MFWYFWLGGWGILALQPGIEPTPPALDAATAAAKSLQSCLTPCDPIDCSPLISKGYSIPSYKYRRRQWHPTPVLLPGESRGWRSLVGCRPWGREESDTTERLHFHFSLSCIGEGNGNPLQCSCLENPRDRRAWWAAVYGVAQSRTRLKRLSSSILKIQMK